MVCVHVCTSDYAGHDHVLMSYMLSQQHFAGHAFFQVVNVNRQQDRNLSQYFASDSEAIETLSPTEPHTLTPPAT